MQVNDIYLELQFDDLSQSIITRSIVKDSINITKQLYNDLHSSSNTCSLQLKDDDSGLIERIINNNSDVFATVRTLYTILFTGLLSNEHSWRVSMTGEDVFQIKIEDIGIRRLNKPCVDYAVCILC